MFVYSLMLCSVVIFKCYPSIVNWGLKSRNRRPQIHQRCTTMLHYNVALQCCTTTLHYNVAIQCCTTALHYNVALQHCTTILQNGTEINFAASRYNICITIVILILDTETYKNMHDTPIHIAVINVLRRARVAINV